MKILLLADINSIHTIKWARSLANNGIEIMIFSLAKPKANEYTNINNIKTITLNKFVEKKEGAINKLQYLFTLPLLKKVLKEFAPDILHAHYATSYGALGALSRFTPFIISVWGSDIYSFPNRSLLHKLLLEHNLRKADVILSTSKQMAEETKLYTNKKIKITPFGIDCTKFKPFLLNQKSNEIVIGTIKTLSPKYGIDLLIKSFARLKKQLEQSSPELALSLKLKIVGAGSEKIKLRELSLKLGILENTKFIGQIPHSEVPFWLNSFDIYVALSREESFGVAVLEASACGLPVVVSNVGGLPEIVNNGETGFIVPTLDTAEEAAKVLEILILDEKLRYKIGTQGREWVVEKYSWNESVKIMINAYQDIIKYQNNS